MNGTRGWTRRAVLTAMLAGGCCLAPAVLAQSASAIAERATQARAAGDGGEERRILEEGIAALGPGNPNAFGLYLQLMQSNSDLGNLARAARAAEAAIPLAQLPGQQVVAITRVYVINSALRDRRKAAEYGPQVEALLPRLRALRGWNQFGALWEAQVAWAKGSANTHEGKLADAEAAFRACLGSAQQFLRTNADSTPGTFMMVDCTAGLLNAQIATGQLAAAAVLADQLRTAIDRVVEVQRRPAIANRVRGVFALLAMQQGRLEEARRLLEENLARLGRDKDSAYSFRVAATLLELAQLEMLQGRWPQALEWHQRREAMLRDMGAERGGAGLASTEHVYTLIRLGQAQRALEMSTRMLESRRAIFDDNGLPLWEARVHHGLALAAVGRHAEALRELRTAIPRVLDMIRGERSSAESGLLRTARIGWMLDGYIALLSEYARDIGHPDAADAMDEAFRMADLARGSTVQRALAASASRLHISDPALADLARREQDLERELAALSGALGNLLSRGRIAEQDQIVADMRASVARLRAEHARAQTEIGRRFPDYAALLDPKPAGIAEMRKLLKPGEALLAIHVGAEQSTVWAIPAQGAAKFAVAPLGAAQIDAKVVALRKALDPSGDPLGRLPPFPYANAYELYAALLAPVEEGWKEARELIVIPQGRLGQLPFGVLLTAPFTASPAKPDYAEMAQAPWLIKRVAVSQLPSALALPVLRGQGRTARAERAFIGFGDPVFTPGGGAQAGTRGLYARRNLPDLLRQAAAAQEGADAPMAPPVNFSLLPALPDTAQEIAEVAGVLSADRGRDVFLQNRASEATLKKTDLSPYRVVMFATHGLMSGELPGLYQPALALSNPALTGDGEDGLLTMEEILALKLKADWVVLSACNTAAAGDSSGESVSGLGRAFFYAGAKSLLVTNWAVETESARMLTTELFRQQAANPGLTRAAALRQSMLSLMQKSRPEFSYAHPMFWAPYTIVGDGGQ